MCMREACCKAVDVTMALLIGLQHGGLALCQIQLPVHVCIVLQRTSHYQC